MPKSRSRKTRNRSNKQRRRNRRERASEARTLVATLRPGESLEHLLTEEDRSHLEQEVEAAARGDARSALEHHMSAPVVEEALTHHQLGELVALGDDAPRWMYSRWAVGQAYRWMLLTEDPRTDDIVRLVLAATHFDHLDEIADDDVALREYGSLVAATDWLCEQLAVYEGGGLRDFLDVRAEPGLVSRADELEEWERAAMSAYELVTVREDVLEARRLSDDATVELLNLGATEAGWDACVVGRVVPISVWPFAMFESRPVVVDRITATDVARRCMFEDDDLGWFWAMAEARAEGRLGRGFSCGNATLFSTDLMPMRDDPATSQKELPGRIVELMDAGLSEDVANGVTVAEVAVAAAQVSPEAAAAVGPHLTAVLSEPRTYEACLQHAAPVENETPWRVLAGCTPSPVRERCLELAESCARGRPSS